MADFEEEGFNLVRLEPQAGGPNIYSIAQRHKRGRVERDWLIEGLLPRRCVAILSGWSSVGKTHIANDLMLSVALGLPFAGCDVRRTCGAVLFAAEGQDDVVPRWDVIEQAKIFPHYDHHDISHEAPYPLSWTDQVPRLTAPDALDQYSKMLTATVASQRLMMRDSYQGLGLALIDTVAAAADMTDDQHNAAGTNQGIFNTLHQLARTFDLCVMVVDHLGKDATRGTRGSNAKEASADVVWRVTGTVSEEGTVSHTAMTISKLRGGASGKRIPYTLKPVRMPVVNGKREDGVVVQWEVAGNGMSVPRQNKRHAVLMKAIDEAIMEKHQWVRMDRNANFKAVESGLIWEKYKLSAAATAENGAAREESMRKAYNRAMKDSSDAGLIAQKMKSDKSVVVWRTDYKFADSYVVSDDAKA